MLDRFANGARRVARWSGDHVTIIAGTVGTLVGVIALFAFLIASCDPFPNFDLGTLGGPPVEPISIPHAACPYLRVVRVTAQAAGHWEQLPAPGNPTAWREFVRRMAPRVATFQDAVRAAIPHVPGPVAVQLRWVMLDLHVGLPALLRAKTRADYQLASVIGGYGSLVHASELVGNACGFTVVA